MPLTSHANKIEPAQPRPQTDQTMRALVWKGIKKIGYKKVPRPAIGAPHEAIIKITSTSVCGSDLHLYHGSIPAMRNGDILGHECMGIVDEAGTAVKDVRKGDRVVVSACIADGTCWFCRQGFPSACEGTNESPIMDKLYGSSSAGIFGYSHLTGAYPGGQAEYISVPHADFNTLKVPDTLSDEQALFLSDIVPTGWHATELGRVAKGQTVAVWGCGPVGLMAQEWCRFKGAARVIAVDGIDYRLKVAADRGATTINFHNEDVLERIKEITKGRGPDVCIEAVGFRYTKTPHHWLQRRAKLEWDSIDALSECIRACRKCGWVSIVGDFAGYANQFPIGAFMEKGLQAGSGQVHVQRYWKDLLKIIARGDFDPTFVVSHRWPLKKGPDAYKMFDEKANDALKVVLHP